MGGIYSNSFHDGVTHLICSVVRSRKYEVAVEKDIPIMTLDWVEQVWEKGKHEAIHATDPQFLRYRCPALLGLSITISQLVRSDRETLKKMIENHGGVYSPSLDMENTTLVVLLKPEGDKYKYAKRWNIPCITSNWVYDSIEKGCSLPTDGYRVELQNREKVSTPEKCDRTVAHLQEVSMCSTICHPNDDTAGAPQQVNETQASNVTAMSTLKSAAPESVLYDMERVKKAGHFLEDCRFFLSGFLETEIDKLRLVIQTAGGVTLSQLAPSVTHLVCKSAHPGHFRLIEELKLSPYKVTLQWIVESMLMGRPVPEEDFAFIYQPPEADKPNQKTQEEAETQFEDDLLAQYKTEAPPLANKDETAQQPVEEDETEVEKFLMGKKLYLSGVESEQESDLVDWINEAGGEVVSMQEAGEIDYLITGLVFDPSKKTFCMTFKQVLNHLWLDDCFDEGKLANIEYYHKPIPDFGHDKPCHDVVVGISNYSGRERSFISKLAVALGMTSQEVFAKRDKRGAKKNTHLICKSPEGTKYDAAISWGLPVVNKDWLLQCLIHKTWVSEEPFWVGDSKISTPGKPLPQSLNQNLDDTEVIINNPDVNPNPETTTPQNLPKRRRLTMETPEVDLEKFRPKKFQLDLTNPEMTSPSKWAAGSEPSFAATQATQGSAKRRRQTENFDMPGVATPETPYGAFLYGPNPTPRTRKYYKKECEELGKFQLPDEEIQKKREKMLDDSFIAPTNPDTPNAPRLDKVPTPLREKTKDELEAKGLVVLGRDKRRFSDIMEEKANKLGKSWKVPGKKIKLVNRLSSQSLSSSESLPLKGPLKDVIVYVTKKLEAMQSEIHKVVCDLGGQYKLQYCPVEVTHVVFSGKQNDLTKEFRAARDDKKFVVSPEWIKMCRDEKKRVSEGLFPHSYNPRMSLNLSTVSVSEQGSKAKKSKKESSTETMTTIDQEDKEISAQLAKIDELMDKPTNEEDDVKNDPEVVQEVEEPPAAPAGDASSNDLESEAGRRNSLKMRLSYTTPDKNKLRTTQAVDKTQILWMDPNEAEDKLKLSAMLDKDSQR